MATCYSNLVEEALRRLSYTVFWQWSLTSSLTVKLISNDSVPQWLRTAKFSWTDTLLFMQLLASLTFHQLNLQTLTFDIIKVHNRIPPEIVNEAFEVKNQKYNYTAKKYNFIQMCICSVGMLILLRTYRNNCFLRNSGLDFKSLGFI